MELDFGIVLAKYPCVEFTRRQADKESKKSILQIQGNETNAFPS